MLNTLQSREGRKKKIRADRITEFTNFGNEVQRQCSCEFQYWRRVTYTSEVVTIWSISFKKSVQRSVS